MNTTLTKNDKKETKEELAASAATTVPTTAVPERFVRPGYSLKSDDKKHEVTIHVPGARKKDVEISMSHGVLEITARRSVSAPEGWTMLHRELDSADYRLRLKVTTPVEEDGITAKVTNGVLTLTLPVRPEPTPRTIKVG